jgi:hypothetical protein
MARLSIGFYLLISSMFLWGCTTGSDKSISGNYLGVSNNIQESKNDNFFVCEFRKIDSEIANDTALFASIDFIFIEKRWRSKNDLSKETISGYSLILKTKNLLPFNYSFDWLIWLANNETRFRKQDNHTLVADLVDIEAIDTLVADLLVGDVFYPKSSLNGYEKTRFRLGIRD